MNKLIGTSLFILLLLTVSMWAFYSAKRIFGFQDQMSSYGMGGVVAEESRSGLKTIDFELFSDIKKSYISQGYGATSFAATHYSEPWHNGIDIAARYGAPIVSATNGTVLVAGDQDEFCYGRGYGKFIVVRSQDRKYALLYGHLSKINTETGDVVKKGQEIGLVGSTGYTTGPHLHLSIFEGESFIMKNLYGCGLTPSGKDINPVPYLNAID